MGSVIKSKLITNVDANKVNTQLQETIDEYNSCGLIVRIEKVFSNSARRAGSSSNYASELRSYVLVVGYYE
jgi:hypothetical protein